MMYANFKRKRQWVDKGSLPESDTKPELHQQKVMLSVWWDVHGIIMMQLLLPNTNVTAAY